jgi:DNA mismatch endonuclease, patch repair protein
MDSLGKDRRSENMRRIRSKDTSPELRVRRLMYSMGYRYRLHISHLPGKPDIVLRKYKAVIFVHGCFWHQHSACREGRIPSSNSSYWAPKLARNVARDREHAKALKKAGWRVLTLWECDLGEEVTERLQRRIRKFLGGAVN